MKQIKQLLLFISCTLILYACKKEEQHNPNQNIIYRHVYELKSNSPDTLYSMYIPNAFTPDGNGINDNFYAVGNFELISFQIFNRSGHVFYESANRNAKWNGTANSKIVEPGAYLYRFVVADTVGEGHEYTGSVLLCR